MRDGGDQSYGWEATVLRGRVLVEEARCHRGGVVDTRWLASAATWLAEAAPSWEEMAGEVPVVRTYRSICASVDLEAWLIAWPAGGRLELHDHGGAPGALRVVHGRLEEAFAVAEPAEPATPRGARRLRTPLRRREFDRGGGTGFGDGGARHGEYVHDVRNPGGPVATSVHIYGPAQRPMGFYRLDGDLLRLLPTGSDGAEIMPPAATASIG